MSAAPAAKSRRHDLDWIRVLAVLLLVPFHSALIFALAPQYVVYIKATTNNPDLIHIASFIYIWHMPLLFTIAGAATWFALGARSLGQYIRERALRLLVPVLFACLTLIPFMLYVHYFGKPNAPTFPQAYLHYFTFNLQDMSGYRGTFTPAHLWFVLFLFLFSSVALPLFRYLKRESGQRVVGRLAAWCSIPGVIYLSVILMALATLLPSLGDKNPFYYLVLFVLGFILMANQRFQEIIHRGTIPAVVIALITTVIYFLPEIQRIRLQPNTLAWVAYGLAAQLCTWSWILAFLGLGYTFLNRDSRVLSYASEAAYPFYILHLPVNTVVGYFVLKLNASVGVLYLVINIVTILATLVIYEVAVRRWGITRFLFGMKPRRKGTEPAARPLQQKPA